MWHESGVVRYDEIAFRGLKHCTKMKFFIKDFFSKCADLVKLLKKKHIIVMGQGIYDAFAMIWHVIFRKAYKM